ncbi:hypothetical protein [Roseivivax sp. CAU 1761]
MTRFSSCILSAALVLHAGPGALAQVNDAPESEVAAPAGGGDFDNVEQIGPREWIFRVSIPGEGMAAARLQALNSSVAHVAGLLGAGDGAPQEEYLEKLLIIDEAMEDAGYSAMIRVLSSKDDPKFATQQRRDTEFESNTVAEEDRPEWVLIVPSDVAADGSWDISQRNSTWASK